MYATDAHALHAILTKVAAADPKSGLHAAWQSTLEADQNTAEFAVRHGEVVGQFSRTVQQIAALPEAKRVNYEQWIPYWWRAVVAPDHNWSRGDNGPLIDATHLSLLHTAGDVIEAILGASSSAPGSAEADALREAIAEWIGTLGDGSVTFPDKGVHAAVLTQLQHVLWLIDHQTLFSAATIATATQTCVGALVASAPTLPSAQQPKWKSAFTKLVLVLAAFNLAVDTSAAAIENAENLADLAIEAGSAVHDAVIDDD